MSPNCLFCPTSGPKLKDYSFLFRTVKNDSKLSPDSEWITVLTSCRWHLRFEFSIEVSMLTSCHVVPQVEVINHEQHQHFHLAAWSQSSQSQRTQQQLASSILWLLWWHFAHKCVYILTCCTLKKLESACGWYSCQSSLRLIFFWSVGWISLSCMVDSYLEAISNHVSWSSTSQSLDGGPPKPRLKSLLNIVFVSLCHSEIRHHQFKIAEKRRDAPSASEIIVKSSYSQKTKPVQIVTAPTLASKH